MLLAGAARAAVPSVDDGAKLFSDRALTEANDTIARIYDHTSPHKQVRVETLPTLTAGKQADELAGQRFSEQNVDGVLVLMVKDPHKLAMTVGRGTASRFHDAELVRSVMLERFRHSDYNGGLLAGLRLLESRLTSEFPPGQATARRATPMPWGESVERQPQQSSNTWLWIVALLGGGGLLAWFIYKLRNRQATSTDAPIGDYGHVYGAASHGPGNVGVGSSGGGGWGRSILGGAAGALAGNWLYDRLFHNEHSEGIAHAADRDYDGSSSNLSDHGDVGSTFGGHGDGADWTDGGGADFGGGGGDGGGDW